MHPDHLPPHDLDFEGLVLLDIVGDGALPAMSPNARYWTLHWLRVALWPPPILMLFRAGRALKRIRK